MQAIQRSLPDRVEQRAPLFDPREPGRDDDGLHGHPGIERLAGEITQIDRRIAPLARAAVEQGNPSWGPLMRAGVDKSLFARQVEKYADVYTSRVGNFAAETPYGYLRAARGSLPHDLDDR